MKVGAIIPSTSESLYNCDNCGIDCWRPPEFKKAVEPPKEPEKPETPPEEPKKIEEPEEPPEELPEEKEETKKKKSPFKRKKR